MTITPLFDLHGKVAIVTGGGNGIGKACCELLARAGAAIAVSDRELAAAQTVADGINSAGGKAIAISCNVIKDNDLVHLVERTIKELGGIHILVNNAGGGGGGRENPFTMTVEDFASVFKLNVFSAWRLSQLCVPYMKKGKRADLVILDKDPVQVDPQAIKDIKVVETIKDGVTVYRRE